MKRVKFICIFVYYFVSFWINFFYVHISFIYCTSWTTNQVLALCNNQVFAPAERGDWTFFLHDQQHCSILLSIQFSSIKCQGRLNVNPHNWNKCTLLRWWIAYTCTGWRHLESRRARGVHFSENSKKSLLNLKLFFLHIFETWNWFNILKV